MDNLEFGILIIFTLAICCTAEANQIRNNLGLKFMKEIQSTIDRLSKGSGSDDKNVDGSDFEASSKYMKDMFSSLKNIGANEKEVNDVTINAFLPESKEILENGEVTYHYVISNQFQSIADEHIELVVENYNESCLTENINHISICLSGHQCQSGQVQVVSHTHFLILKVTKLFKDILQSESPKDSVNDLNMDQPQDLHAQINFNQFIDCVFDAPIIATHDGPESEYLVDSLHKHFRNKRDSSDNDISGADDNKSDEKTHTKVKGHAFCHKEKWQVNFKDLGWDKWILYPEQYMTNICVGSCNIDADNDQVSITSNAFLRLNYPQLSKLISSVPEPACVPIKHESASFLFHNISGYERWYIFKTMNDVVAEECGCL